MTYTAYITDRDTKESKVFTHEDESKKNFARNLRGNGYIVHFIATPETFEEESAKYHARLEDQRIKAAAKRSTARMCRVAEQAIAEAESLIAAINAGKAEATEEPTTEEPTQEVKTMRFRKEWFCAQTKKIEKDNMPNITRFDADVEFAVVNCTENQESAAIRKAVERFVELLKKRDNMAVLVDTLEMMLNCNEYDQRSNYNEIRNGGGAYEVEIDRYTDTELNIYVRICESCDDAQEVEEPKEAEEENQEEEKPTENVIDSVFIAEMIEALEYFKRCLASYSNMSRDGSTRFKDDIPGDFYGSNECYILMRAFNERLKARNAKTYYEIQNEFASLSECFEEIQSKFEHGDTREIHEIIAEYNFS